MKQACRGRVFAATLALVSTGDHAWARSKASPAASRISAPVRVVAPRPPSKPVSNLPVASSNRGPVVVAPQNLQRPSVINPKTLIAVPPRTGGVAIVNPPKPAAKPYPFGQPGADAIRRVYPEAYVVGAGAVGTAARGTAAAANVARREIQIYRATRPEPPTANQVKNFASQGDRQLDKSRQSLQRQADVHVSKIRDARRSGGHTSSMEREVRSFRQQMQAIDQAKKGRR